MKIFKTLLISLAILPGFIGAGYCLNVAPARIEITIDPIKDYEGALIVKNTDNRLINVRLRLEDWRKAVEGAPGKGQAEFKWIKLEVSEFELKAGGEREVKFKINAPKNIRGELNTMVFVEGAPKEVSEGAIGINTSIGVPIYAMVKGTEIFKAEAEGIKIINRSPLEMAVTIKNSGNVHIRPSGDITLRTKSGKELFRVPLNKYNYPVLPFSSRTLEIRSNDRLEEGEYIAEIKMGYGYNKKHGKKIALEVL